MKLDTKSIFTGVAATISAAVIMGFSQTISETEARSLNNVQQINTLIEKEQRIYDNVEVIRQDVKEILSRLPE
tara:strand:+ start:377 stop:595 length:219 start_codon:yes stop_codon:yes gene_type:complete